MNLSCKKSRNKNIMGIIKILAKTHKVNITPIDAPEDIANGIPPRNSAIGKALNIIP